MSAVSLELRSGDERHERNRTIGRMIKAKRVLVLHLSLNNAASLTGPLNSVSHISGQHWNNIEAGNSKKITHRVELAMIEALKLPADWARLPLPDIERRLGLPEDWKQLLDDYEGEQPARGNPGRSDAALIRQLSQLVGDLAAAEKRLNEPPPPSDE